MARKNALDLLNRLTSAGESTFSTSQAAELLDRSPQSTVNTLSRLVDDGLIGRVSRGHYAIRPFGQLGTSAAAEDTSLAVAAVFANRPHRIAYRSAFAHHGLLVRPSRVIQVACSDEIRITRLAGRPAEFVREDLGTIHLGSVDAGYGADVSSLDRALLDGARRPHVVGGLSVLGEALGAVGHEVDAKQIRSLAAAMDSSAALRRLASVALVLGLEDLAVNLLAGVSTFRNHVLADPRQEGSIEWADDEAGVVWTADSLGEVQNA